MGWGVSGGGDKSELYYVYMWAHTLIIGVTFTSPEQTGVCVRACVRDLNARLMWLLYIYVAARPSGPTGCLF